MIPKTLYVFDVDFKQTIAQQSEAMWSATAGIIEIQPNVIKYSKNKKKSATLSSELANIFPYRIAYIPTNKSPMKKQIRDATKAPVCLLFFVAAIVFALTVFCGGTLKYTNG